MKYFEGIDLFAGAGGVTTGIGQARYGDLSIACVKVAINHDAVALASHQVNHPDTIHFTEDITEFDVRRLPEFADRENKIIYIWASLECTNFSNAKGGMPRDADSRTLANSLFPYIRKVRPHYIFIENVEEFRSWGPLTSRVMWKDKTSHGPYSPLWLNRKTGRLEAKLIPESRTRGRDYLRWIKRICELGYDYDDRTLNAADFGAYTSRKRYFGIFALKGYPIRFPKPTHSRRANGLKSWRPVRDVLDFCDEGESIFTRKKPLVERTLRRIHAGLERYATQNTWIVKYLSNDAQSGVNAGAGIDHPAPTVTTQNRLYVANLRRYGASEHSWIVKYYNNGSRLGVDPGSGIHRPAPTLTTRPGIYLANVVFLQSYNGNVESGSSSIDQPARTLLTKDRLCKVAVSRWMDWNYTGDHHHQSIHRPCRVITATPQGRLVSARWLDKQYNGHENHQPVIVPAGAITTNPKLALVSVEGFMMSMNYNNSPSSLHVPARTITATRPIYVVTTQSGFLMPTNYENLPTSLRLPATTITAGRKHHYLVNPQFATPGLGIDNPCFTLIARMDKKPPYLVTAEDGHPAIRINPDDSPTMKKIKAFMAENGIVDIRMRMLRIDELKRITGLPEDYVLLGNKGEQKKFIGNAVPPVVPQKIIETLFREINGLSDTARETGLPLFET